MGLFKTLSVLVIIIICFMLLAGAISEIQYSYKSYRNMDDHNATCYWDRGWFNIPVAKICSYNDTIIIQKENETLIPNGSLDFLKG